MLFSTRHATTQASQPVHRSRSITIPRCGLFVLCSSVILFVQRIWLSILASTFHMLLKLSSKSDQIGFSSDSGNRRSNRLSLQTKWIQLRDIWPTVVGVATECCVPLA